MIVDNILIIAALGWHTIVGFPLDWQELRSRNALRGFVLGAEIMQVSLPFWGTRIVFIS